MRKVDFQELLTRLLRLEAPRFKIEKFGSKLGGSVVSDTFKGKGDSDRQDMIWNALEAEFGADAARMFGTLLAYADAEWDIDLPPHERRPSAPARPGRRRAVESAGVKMMAVPVKLVPKVQKLIARRAS